jgi:hypothetical protein
LRCSISFTPLLLPIGGLRTRTKQKSDDRQAFEFAYALFQARQVDPEAAQMIVKAAEAGLIQINHATELLMQLSRPTSKRHLFG